MMREGKGLKEGSIMIIKCPGDILLKEYLVKTGQSLLTACGGRGNCGKCAVRIVKGDVAVNTMDRIWFSEKQLEEGWRLGCQVYAETDIYVEVGEKCL